MERDGKDKEEREAKNFALLQITWFSSTLLWLCFASYLQAQV